MNNRRIAAFAAATLLAGVATAGDDALMEKSRNLARAFGAELKNELRSSLENGGPVAAIAVCRDQAPRIASQLSRSSGAKLRRTSLRFRNPGNAPEPWEARVLGEFEASAVSGDGEQPLEYFAREEDGTIRYMAAITTGGVCLACHGATLASEISEQLDADYPFDQARGYALGDIRGAFSVTWPAVSFDTGR